MPAPPCYLDECVDCHLVEALRERGFTVTSASGEGNLSNADEFHLRYASARGWVVITHNGRHFRPLHEDFRVRGEQHAGVIVFPSTPPPERRKMRAAMMLSWIDTLDSHQSLYFKWGHLQERLEQGYRLPAYSEEDVRIALGR
jgi:hypothetical protein